MKTKRCVLCDGKMVLYVIRRSRRSVIIECLDCGEQAVVLIDKQAVRILLEWVKKNG